MSKQERLRAAPAGPMMKIIELIDEQAADGGKRMKFLARPVSSLAAVWAGCSTVASS
jgi:hypothetical protein